MTGTTTPAPRLLVREVTVPGLPEYVRQVRTLARMASASPYQAEAAALCVSELITNALVHSRSGLPGGTITVTIEPGQQEPGELRISVRDGGSRTAPRPLAFRTDGPDIPVHGYGLRIVAAVADRWGCVPQLDGWVTWCEIPEAAL